MPPELDASLPLPPACPSPPPPEDDEVKAPPDPVAADDAAIRNWEPPIDEVDDALPLLGAPADPPEAAAEPAGPMRMGMMGEPSLTIWFR